MLTIYILTEEGRVYSDEGCEYIREYLHERFGVNEDLEFCMGASLNDTGQFAKTLLGSMRNDDEPSCFIVLSHDAGIAFIEGTRDNIINFVVDAINNPEDTSWDVFYGELMTYLEKLKDTYETENNNESEIKEVYPYAEPKKL